MTLMSEKALALSLSAPRAPPKESSHYAILHRQKSNPNDHPHLPSPPTAEGIERFLGGLLPQSWQNDFRDSGNFRSLVDSLVTFGAPFIGVASPRAVLDFARLSSQFERFSYGPHPMQYVDFFLPEEENKCTGVVVFIHGGAWGSGLPWFYRLVAKPFLKVNRAVAVVGYRTYPDAHVDGQVHDSGLAMDTLAKKYPWLLSKRCTLMGHSSGAHVAFLLLVERGHQELAAKQKHGNQIEKDSRFRIHEFVGMSGPYDISHHFDYEAARGVEELSPMKPVNGYTRELFRTNSPAQRLTCYLRETLECDPLQFHHVLPRLAFVHGIEDDTVPFTATAEAARVVRSCGVQCDELYVPGLGHQDAVMELMFGGKTCEYILNWMEHPTSSATRIPTSKL